MERRAAAIGSAVWFVLAPVLVAVLTPWWIGRETGHDPAWPLRALGAVVAVAGLALVARCFAEFVAARGTPAPVAPTERLVVTGLYRHVRNPMYVAVVATILGVALWHASVWVLGYAAAVWAATTAFVLFYEEPALRRQFGGEYDAYLAAVPRWVPRRRPWTPLPAEPTGEHHEDDGDRDAGGHG
jgi:protein-S-isoprenylcysteine O-methyltransferase Ste14